MLPEMALLDDQLCFALYATSRAVTASYQPLLSKLGLTYPQYLVLLCLWEEDGASVSRLGARLFLDSGTLTPLLQRMEREGILTRARDASDERVVRVHLTPRGRKLKAQAPRISEGIFCALASSPKEIVRLRGSLRTLLAKLTSKPSAKLRPNALTKKPRTSKNPRPSKKKKEASP